MSDAAFQQRRFRTAAGHYLAGRPAYAPGLIARLAQMAGLGRADRVLDLGCGPGQLARAFAPLVAEVVGLDPEPEMLAIAREASAGIANIAFHQAASTDLPVFGRFRLVVMGRSFHWMDRPDTLRRLDAMIETQGAVALLSDQHPELPDNAWYRAYRDILRDYSGGDSARTRRTAPGWIPHTAILLDSAFAQVEEIAVYERRPVTADTLVERALSMSSTSRARLGDRADEMTAQIRSALPAAPLHEVVASHALVARRP